jgi:hypothetical protein
MTAIRQAVIFSDLHCGCQFGLCPQGKIRLDGGGTYTPPKRQRHLSELWEYAWKHWVPKATRGEPYAVVVNGDVLDGVHHNSVTQITHNLNDQRRIAYDVLAPIRDKTDAFYMVRGTEAHVGQSAQDEESLAGQLDAVRDDNGNAARYELWLALGPALVNCAHHIGTSGSMAYETSALMRELAELMIDSARWGHRPPDVVVRSHRHTHVEVRIPTQNVYGICFTTAAWQLKTPFASRVAGARTVTPHIGLSLVRRGDEEIYTRHFVQSLKRSRVATPRRRNG